LNGLKRCQYNFEETIEYLINDPSSDAPLRREDHNDNESSTYDATTTATTSERHSKVKLKKKKEKSEKSDAVISKKVCSSVMCSH
jgi:hypothetical protein